MALGPNPLSGGVIGNAWMKLSYKVDSSGLKTSKQSMLGLGLAAGSAGKQIQMMFAKYIGAAALIAAVKNTTAAFIEFDKHLRNTHTLITATEVELQKIGKGIRALARDFNVSAAASQASLYQIYSATFYSAEAMHILEQGAKGAVAGLAELKPTVDMLTTVLNAYRMSADQTTHINDLLFTAIRYGKTTLVELSHQFGRLAGVAAPVGASIEDMTAAIATLTRQGIMTDWAITSLRQTLMQFIKPTQNLKKALQGLGYESGSAMVKHYGFAGALREITKWAKENNVEMDQMFTNIRAITAVLPLATIAAGEYAKDQERMANAAGAAAIAFTKAERSIAYQLKKFTTLVNDMAISIGKVFVPALMMMVNALEMLVTPLRKAVEIFDVIGGDYFIAIAAGIGTLIVAVWALNKALVALVGLMGGLMASKALMLSVLGAGGGITGQALKSLLILGGGSLAMGLGKAALGGLAAAFAVQALVNFDLKLGEVTGLESVRRGAWSAVQAVLGGAIATAIFGLGAAPGAIIAAVGVTIKILHEISVRTAERAVTAAEAARGAFAAGGGIAQLLAFPTLEGAKGLNLFAKTLVEANDEIADTRENFQAMVDILKKFYVPIEGWHGFITGWRQDFGDISQDIIDFGWLVAQLGDKALEAKQEGEGLLQGLADLSYGFSEIQDQTLATLPIISETFTAIGVAIENISTQFDQARGDWLLLTDTLSDQNITAEEAIKTWGDMGAMLTKWSKIADIAESQGWESAEALRRFADMMDVVINGLGKITTAFQQFIADLAAPITAAGALAQAGEIIGRMRAGELTLQDLIAGGAGLGGLQALLETARVGAYRGGALELIPEIDAALAELALAIGQTPEEIQAALEAAQRKADQAAREALQAAREAAAAQQKAFRDIFKTPILESLRSGDWMKAAEAIRIFAQSRNDLMSTAAALSTANDQVIDEAEVLQLIVGAQRELLSTLDSMILAMRIAGEDATALEEMKYAIEDLFDPLGELKKKLREVVGVPIAKAGSAGEQFRALINVMLGRSTTVPSMRVGGMIEREGLFWGHAGEAVIPAEAASSVAGGMEDMASTIRVCTGDVCYEIEQVAEATQTLEECASRVCGTFEQVTISSQALIDIQAALAQASAGSVTALNDLLEAAEPGSETWNLIFDSIDEYRASIEGLISDYEVIGESADALEINLLNFDAALQETTPLLLKMKNALRDLLSSIGETIKSGLKELIRGFFSAGDAAESLGVSLNVPTGYKVTRAAWAAAAPGIPGIARGAGEGFSLAEWAANLALEIVGALTDALVDFMWENFITPIVWEKFIKKFLWEKVIKEFLWEKVIKPFIWKPIIMPAVTAIYNFVASLISGMATLIGFGKALAGLFIIFTGLGVAIGVVEAVLAFLWGAIQGVGDLLSAFFKPIIEAVGWAWEALTPLIDGARKLFGALAPIMEIFGEIVAWGIYLITPLFSAFGAALGLIGDIIHTVAGGIKWVWDHTLAPVMNAIAWAFRGLGNTIGGLLSIIGGVLTPAISAVARLLGGAFRIAINVITAAVNVFAGAIKVITNIVKAIGNLVIGTINAIINLINFIPFINIPNIPYLERGGEVLSGGMAYLHTGEIVAPAALAQPLGTGVGGDIILDNTIMLDGDVLWHGMRRVNRNEERRKTGSSIGGRAWRSG